MLKKGMNPLISTFILIAGAVTIGVLIMNIGSIGSSCTGEEISFLERSGNIYACYDNTNIKAIISNDALVDIKHFTLFINDEKLKLEQDLSYGKIYQMKVPYPGDVKTLRIIPNSCEENSVNVKPSRCSG